MERFKNILLVVNSKIKNPAALSCAFLLAKNNNAKLKIVDVIKETSGYQPILPALASDINLHDLLIGEKREQLEHLLMPFQGEGVETSIKIISGRPFLEIVREVIRKDHDLVIITPEGKSEFKEMLFGTTTMHIMRKCPCPVWAIKPSSDIPFPRILAAVNPDPMKMNDKGSTLNRMILEMASSLAEMHKSELHVIHAWEFPVRTAMISRKELDVMNNEVERIHRSSFYSLLKRFVPDLPESRIHLLEGDAGVQIPRFAKEEDVDLIVMGTLSKTGIPGLFIGNTAEKVLYRVDCSVLAIKPDGFTTPVEVIE